MHPSMPAERECYAMLGVKKFLKDAQILLRRFDRPESLDLNFLEWLYNRLKKVVSKKLKNKDFWKDFHVLRTSEGFSQHWKKYLEATGVETKAIFLQP